MFPLQPKRRPLFGPSLLSVAIHAGLAVVWLLGTRVRPVHVFSLPGTASGSRIELTYLPGQAPASTAVTAVKPKPKTTSTKPPIPATAAPSLPSTQPPVVNEAARLNKISAPAAATPDGQSGSDSWGSGSIQIALTTFSPSPEPDLSSLPHGVQGDVVVEVTIDPTGKVADLEVQRTLGYGIESYVMSTLKTWTFRPATKDGTPIASVQELHFHFGPV